MPESQVKSRRAARARKRQALRRVKVFIAIGMVVAAVVIAAVILTSSGGDDATTVAELQLFDFGIDGDLEVPAGEVQLAAVNVGVEPHNVGIRGGAISNEVGPGGTIELDIGDLAPGTYELFCDIPGHVELGMTVPFVVTAPVSSTG